MKKYKVNIIAICSLFLAMFLSGFTHSFAQAKYHAQTIDVSLTGTSSIHDWEMKSDKGQFEATIAVAGEKV
ncbi:MAG: hypothetical protein ABIS01_01795, partial [Ferruginibacter sp.]